MHLSEHSSPRKMPLYEKVADKVAALIAQGMFQAGDRIPSVRELSAEWKISLTTAMEAYRLLEDRDWIEVRPRSGHYVRVRAAGGSVEPEVSQPDSRPTEVGVGELILRVIRDMQNPGLIPLGAVAPNPALMPIKALNRALLTVGRRDPLASSRYDLPPGCEPLRVQIARRLLSCGCTVSPDQIITTTGCQEALVLALRAVCQPGDTVAIESPTYFNFLQAIEMLGLRALEIPTHPREGILLDQLDEAIRRYPVRACLLCTNFGNPLGGCMPDEKKRALVEMLAQENIPLIEDDINGDLSYSTTRPWVAKAFDRTGSVLLCSSFSKTLAPGYRAGWVVAGRYHARIEHLKVTSSIASATLPQLAVAEFLANGGYERYLRRVRRIYARQIALLIQAVGHYFPSSTRVTRPSGGVVLWIECPEYVNALDLYAQALQEGISLAPGPIFSTSRRYGRYIRLHAAYWSPREEGAVERLGQLVARMAG